MPLNATTYLEEHGWEGKGVALDGKQGRGLKKPLALPMKRNQRGLGKDRDRATEWWDCLFETSAKSINIQVGAEKKDATDKALEAASTALSQKKGKEKANGIEKVVAAKTGKFSLASQAKREYARKMLMSGFVRAGKASLINTAETDLERILLEQEKKQPEKVAPILTEPTEEERKRIKEEKRKRKEGKRLKKEASKSSKKRKRDEGEKAKDKDKKESKRSKKSLPRT